MRNNPAKHFSTGIKTVALLLLFTVILSACLPKAKVIQNNNTNEPVFCTQDAKMCPDGSFVGRQGPDCQFAPCPDLPKFQTINTADLGAAKAFQLSATVPGHWQVEVVPEIEAINFYDPTAGGETAKDQSQIFVRYFTADDFLTLSTVTIFNKTNTSVVGRPAVIYDIEKKSGVADFPHQPFWRNIRHQVTDVRQSDSSPATFYVFGQRPGLDESIWTNFLNSLTFNNEPAKQVIDYSPDRITKKKFGTYVTPKNSPVSPEKFTGYHTAVDFEYDDITTDVLVTALNDGEVVYSGSVSGYGGVVVINHNINGTNYNVIYGHLDPNGLIGVGDQITARQVIGTLGQGFSTETDGERKHLHLGLYKGSDINLKGYVSDKADLVNWADPATVLFSTK